MSLLLFFACDPEKPAGTDPDSGGYTVDSGLPDSNPTTDSGTTDSNSSTDSNPNTDSGNTDSGNTDSGHTDSGDSGTTPLPASSRCIDPGDLQGACTSGVYAEDWSLNTRYEWALTDGFNHSRLQATDSSGTRLITLVETQFSWHQTGGLTVLPDGDLVIAGSTLPYVTLTVGADTVDLGTDYVRFIARLSPDGVMRWVVTVVGITGEPVVVSARSDGLVLVSGGMYQDTVFGDHTATTTFFFDNTFVAALDDSGTWAWASSANLSNGRLYFEDMVLAADDGAQIQGTYTGTLTLDTGPMSCASGMLCPITATVAPDGTWVSATPR